MLPTNVSPLPDVRKIAVLRANRIGDFVVTLPALAALRAAYPSAEIVLLGLPWHAAFLRGRPGPIDRVVPIPPCRGVGEPEGYVEDVAGLARFFAAMRAEHFDLALQCHGGGRYSNPFVARLGARLTAGLRARDAPPLDRWLPYLLDQHEVVRFLEVAALVGAVPVTLEPRLAVVAADRAATDAALPDDGRPTVAIHPGATDPRRRWPIERFAAVGDALVESGMWVVLIGDAGERALTAGVARAMAAPAHDLAGAVGLGGLLGLLARCRLVVGNDSGPLHLAGAVGTPTVGVYLGRNLLHYGPLTRARHRPLITWRAGCPRCGRGAEDEECGHPDTWVAGVTSRAMLDAAHDLLATGATGDTILAPPDGVAGEVGANSTVGN